MLLLFLNLTKVSLRYLNNLISDVSTRGTQLVVKMYLPFNYVFLFVVCRF